MDHCARAKIKDITVYCNCSAATSEIFEEVDDNFLNYKELYFEPSSDQKVESFWKYLDYQNVPLPSVGESKSNKKRKLQKHGKSVEKRGQKQFKFDEKLQQDAEFKSTNWAGKLAYLQSKGYDKILTHRKSCNICKYDDFDTTFADMNCRQIVSGLPVLPLPKKIKIKTEKNEYISATKSASQTNMHASKISNKVSQISKKLSQPVPKLSAPSSNEQLSINTLYSVHSLDDESKSSVCDERCVVPNVPRLNVLFGYSDTTQNMSKTVQIDSCDNSEDIYVDSNTEIKIKSQRQKKIMFHSKLDLRRSDHNSKSACSLAHDDDDDDPKTCTLSWILPTSMKK